MSILYVADRRSDSFQRERGTVDVVCAGYIRGGVTALAGKRDYPVYVDEQIQLFDVVAASAGVRGKQMLPAPDDYLRATKANVGPISRSD